MEELDLRGLKCPLPAMRTEKRLREAPRGAIFAVTADDPLASLDIAHLCRSEGHRLVEERRLDGTAVRFVIERG